MTTYIETNSTLICYSVICRSKLLSGKGGIRTLGGPEPTTVFETVPFNHSGTFPCWDKIILCPTCGGDYNRDLLASTMAGKHRLRSARIIFPRSNAVQDNRPHAYFELSIFLSVRRQAMLHHAQGKFSSQYL